MTTTRVLRIRTGAPEQLLDITEQVARFVPSGETGVVTLFVRHTTAALTVNENADRAVQRDMLAWLSKLVPASETFEHAEGNSDAHIKASFIGPSLQVPYSNGELLLGRWQGIYLCEFDGPREREVVVLTQGESGAP